LRRNSASTFSGEKAVAEGYVDLVCEQIGLGMVFSDEEKVLK
jgi:hypothetical protein